MSTQLAQLIESTKVAFLSTQSNDDISFEAEAKFAVQALSTDFASKVAMQNKQSVIDAVINVAAIGISLNPAKKQAYLVPREGRICLDISYMGLIDLAVSTQAIKWVQAKVVYQSETFELRDSGQEPLHISKPFEANKGDIVGAYCVAKTEDGDYLTHAMSIEEIHAIRDRSSQSFKSGKNSPWITDKVEMTKKTVVKQAYKYWPKVSAQLQNAIHYMNNDGGEGIESLRPTRNPNKANNNATVDYEAVEEAVSELEKAAEISQANFRRAWKELPESTKNIIGIPERDRIDKLAKENESKTVENQ